MVKLGESNVPLEEDILRRKVEFVQSWIEWNAQNSEQIIRNNSANNSTEVIFTVPDNQTFFLTSACISVANQGTSANRVGTLFRDNISATDSVFLRVGCHNAVSVNSISLSFPMPLKFESGSVIQHNAGSTTDSRACIQGFLVSKRIS